MTNLEYLRTLEAEQLTEAIKGVDECETCAYKNTSSCFGGDCHEGFIEWLKQERNPELKPCPFCGGKARAHDTVYGTSFVSCNNCSAEVRGDAKAEVIEKWNRRAK